ncbi:MAG: 5-formyltetrahydrofolate cyclo-ligase [Phycisphaerales bacterium]|nr:5-formyltetrahydrofolate cyclo-ligase [Phycisphaerales bacterium]
MTKADLRSLVKARVAALSPEQRRTASAAACARLMAQPEFQNARVILAFLSLPDEIDADGVTRAALADGRRVCLPRVDWNARTMAPVEIRSLDADVSPPGRHGLREPRVAPAVDAAEIDFVLVPGVALSEEGGRLGRGAGFYDRFLADPRLRAVRCGFAFEAQIVEHVPLEAHDARMNLIVTEQRTIRCDSA